jgi:hypothetical protein
VRARTLLAASRVSDGLTPSLRGNLFSPCSAARDLPLSSPRPAHREDLAGAKPSRRRTCRRSPESRRPSCARLRSESLPPVGICDAFLACEEKKYTRRSTARSLRYGANTASAALPSPENARFGDIEHHLNSKCPNNRTLSIQGFRDSTQALSSLPFSFDFISEAGHGGVFQQKRRTRLISVSTRVATVSGSATIWTCGIAPHPVFARNTC